MSRAETPVAAPHAERLEFVDAFVVHALSSPSPDRLAARPHVAVGVAALAAIIAVLVGVVTGLFASDKGQQQYPTGPIPVPFSPSPASTTRVPITSFTPSASGGLARGAVGPPSAGQAA